MTPALPRRDLPTAAVLGRGPMEHVGVNILWPFPVRDSGNHNIVAMDFFTKWPEAYVVPDQRATTTAEKLVE